MLKKINCYLKSPKNILKKNYLNTKIKILNNDFLKFKYNFSKNSNLVFFWYGASSRFILKKILISFKKKFRYNKIFFYIIPKSDIPKDLKNIKVLFVFNDFKNDPSRNSKIIKLL